ncbi:MAG: hypothetical protein NC247_14255 [Ruminococcus flavefaciens]|nr:hypothetical protein [Ruminococcus flavefaciens]MCM1362946.1 hypothetical protein [Clostridiales bacterium]
MSEKKDFRFDKKAEKYDDCYEGKLSEKFYTLVIENVTLSEGMNILEMGCGSMKRYSKHWQTTNRNFTRNSKNFSMIISRPLKLLFKRS